MISVVFKPINRCVCFDSARQGVPNCVASYPESTIDLMLESRGHLIITL